MNHILRVFFDIDLRNGHDGLYNVAKLENLNLKKLHPGEFAVFINRKQTSVKLFASNNVIAYLRHSRRIDLETIKHLPTVFNGGQISYTKAIEKVLATKLKVLSQ